MAASTYSNFKIYNDEFYDGMFEYVTQNLGAFNAASNNAIVLESFFKKGHYSMESFFSTIANSVTRRDISSVAAATILGPSQKELVDVKLNGKIGPVDVTMDALKKSGMPMDEFSYYLGQQVAKEKTKYQLNAVLGAGVAADIDYAIMVDALAKMGDAASEIACWVMHSKVYYDLVKTVISDKLFDLTSFAVYTGSPITFGRPVVVTDCPHLVYTATGTKYRTLALTRGAITCNESEKDLIVSDQVTGTENIMFRYQGEFAFNVGVKGFAWDVANGGLNPEASAVVTTTNWDRQVADVKMGPGSIILTL